MLNFVPITLRGSVATEAMTATSAETGIRYLSTPAPSGEGCLLLIEDVDGAPAGGPPPLSFDSEGEAIDYADRFDANQTVAELYALPCVLEARELALGTAVERHWPDRASALESARRILNTEYAAYMTVSRAAWWSARAVRLLKAYGRVETPDIVLTLSTPAASGDPVAS